jgi:hypothetical protein
VRQPARPLDEGLRVRVLVLLSGSLFLLLAHALIPIGEFIHRGDDAYYYFQVAANYPRLGFWSFDGIHPTNGVQPLWAILLTGIALVLAPLGLTDADLLARVFVAFTAVLHFASSMVLFHLLARQVSVGTALVAAGALLLPIGMVWSRVWGMENSLYAMTLVSAVAYFQLVFRHRQSTLSAAILGFLLGLAALSRLNASLLIPCLLLYYLLSEHGSLRERLRLTIVIGAAASALILPYFAANYATTGHPLPISGAVKALKLEQGLAARQITGPLSLDFLAMLHQETRKPIEWFITSRAVDAFWPVGGRVIFNGEVNYATLLAVSSLFVLGPLALGRPIEWLGFLRSRFARLLPFSYLLVFGLLDLAVTLLLYPFDVGYAGIRWWFVEHEIIIVVLVATLVAAVLSYSATRLVRRSWHVGIVTTGLILLVAFHTQQMARFYWDGKMEYRDWNLSWNDESYLAANWISSNLPEDAIVGSWNAGVLGYYTTRTVVNLDGLINNFELLPYLKEGRIADYIKQKRIGYLSDIEKQFKSTRVKEKLQLKQVYRHYSRFMRQDYLIYRVDDVTPKT